MKSKLLFFASLRDLMGQEELLLELDGPTRVHDLLGKLEESHPQLKKFERRFRVAVNQEFVENEHLVEPGAEIAFVPPVSGGAPCAVRASVTEEQLDLQSLTQEVMRNHCGAVVTFCGTVRDLTGDQVTDKLHYSAYEAMAEKEIHKICEEAMEKWELGAAVVEHRVGELNPGDIAVVAACSAPHRKEAFEAARFLIDTTKERVPLWKKECGPDGKAWIEGDARVPTS